MKPNDTFEDWFDLFLQAIDFALTWLLPIAVASFVIYLFYLYSLQNV